MRADVTLGKCEICNVVFTSPTQKLSHLNGRRHEEECRFRGIPLEPRNKRSNMESEEPRASKRLKSEAYKREDLCKDVRGRKSVNKEPTQKEVSSQKTSTKSRSALRKKANKTDE